MSAKDAEVTEEDRTFRRELVRRILAGDDMASTDAFIANARCDAHRAGQLAGLEEAKKNVDRSRASAGSLREVSQSIDARIRELKGET